MLKLLQPGKRPPSEELAARDLLEGGGVEDVVSARHRRADALQVPHVADVELYLVRPRRGTSPGTRGAYRPASSRRARRS